MSPSECSTVVRQQALLSAPASVASATRTASERASKALVASASPLVAFAFPLASDNRR